MMRANECSTSNRPKPLTGFRRE